MKRNQFLFLLGIACCCSIKNFAQTVLPCGTDLAHKRMVAAHPEILQYEADFNRQVKEGLKKIDYSKYAAKTDSVKDESGTDSFWYDIPVVVHVIHDYNAYSESTLSGDYVPDNDIFDDLINWNIVYAGANPDTSSVIAPFKKYIGNPHIRLHFATRDPYGNPTHGITRHRSYLTYNGGDQAKYDDWAPTSYVNIWIVNQMSAVNGEAAAYAYYASDATFNPSGDGIICLSGYLKNEYDGAPLSVSKTINHEMGHMMNLEHPWGGTNSPEVACGDDLVDDTPPTHGHSTEGCVYDHTALYDTDCATGYFKIYPSVVTPTIDSVADYPDTTNAQNIMDYTYCSRMFTKGQVARMHAALNSPVAGRNNLWDSTNLVNTGVYTVNPTTNVPSFTSRPDYKPIPDFSAVSTAIGAATYSTKMGYFTFPGTPVKFLNESWNDTVTKLEWDFSNGATTPSVLSTSSFTNSFSVPGWVTLSMTATGNHAADPAANWDTTYIWKKAVFVANTTATPGDGYYMEFDNSDTANWPTFNYYNNEFKWQMANVGFDDNSCMEYLGYDSRIIIDIAASVFIYPRTGTPVGDFDDMYSIPMDLSAFTDTCNLNFYYSGASRTSNSGNIKDKLEIDYSLNKSATWQTLTTLTKNDLDNKGAVPTAYTPAGSADWAPMTIGLPRSLRYNYITFRFRYWPGVDTNLTSTGNNFYIDRINFSRIPASVSSIQLDHTDVVLVPNPTSGDAYVIVKEANNVTAHVVVTDITGKVVFSTSEPVNGQARINIPHASISVPGMYIVQTTTGNQVSTKKLVVE